MPADHTEKRGCPPYEPQLTLRPLIYGCTTGIRSSRAYERKCADDIAFRFLATDQGPPTSAQQLGMVKMGRVALDSTKLEANASEHKAMSYGHLTDKKEKRNAAARNGPAPATSRPSPTPGRGLPRKARAKPKARANFTGPDSRIMKNSDGACFQAYNPQPTVDAEHQIITVADMTTNPPDALNCTTMLDRSARNTGVRPKRARADR
ncbi:hypothetical protein ACVWXU_001515 [Streptomyces sp. TE33382]